MLIPLLASRIEETNLFAIFIQAGNESTLCQIAAETGASQVIRIVRTT